MVNSTNELKTDQNLAYVHKLFMNYQMHVESAISSYQQYFSKPKDSIIKNYKEQFELANNVKDDLIQGLENLIKDTKGIGVSKVLEVDYAKKVISNYIEDSVNKILNL
ncbi:MAG: hypothetical protein PHN56_00710 [Candidatus Nanoarchaeia archaeon]|nr:hypothetical protein [Candidatus Nanoarchaeia archaeon]